MVLQCMAKKMNRVNLVTIGNLARNAKFFTEEMQNKYNITNILINEESIGLTKEIIISRKQNKITLLMNTIKSYIELLKSDIIISYTGTLSSVLFRYFFVYIKSKKYIAYATGSDLREAIYYKKDGEIIKKFFLKSNKVIVSNYDRFTQNSIKELNLNNVYFHNFYVQTEDNYKYLDNDNYHFSDNYIKAQEFIKGSFSIYMPSNIDFTEIQNNNKHFCSKGNDIAFEVFLKFINNYPDTKILLRNGGPDLELSKSLLSKIQKSVFFVDILNKKELLNLINKADVIFDQFYLDAFGGIGIEAASLEKPLLTLPPSNHFYKDDPHPFLFNFNSIDLYNNLENLYFDNEYRKKYSKECKDWVFRNHSKKEIFKLEKIIRDTIG